MPRKKKETAPAPTPRTSLKSSIQRRSSREKAFFVQATISFSLEQTNPNTPVIRPVISLHEYYKDSAYDDHAIHSFSEVYISDPSGNYKDASELDYIDVGDGEKIFIFQNFESMLSPEFIHSFRAAREIESALNGVIIQINDTNMSNAQRLETAKQVCEHVLNNVISKRGDKYFLRARSREGFKKRLETEIKTAMQTVKNADYGAVNISVELQNDLIDAANLSITRQADREKTPTYRRIKSDIMKSRQGDTQQLLLFQERIDEIVTNSLLDRAGGDGIALVWAVLRMRQEARQYAKAHGVDYNSTDPVDMAVFGLPEYGVFPDGLRGDRYTIEANDVLKRLKLPYQGMSGTRERARARQALDDFAALQYVQRWEKSGARWHSFAFAYTMVRNREYWTFSNFTKDFLLPQDIKFSKAEVEYIPYVYEHFTQSREAADGIIKFMTVAAMRLHQEERRRIAAYKGASSAKNPLITPHTEEIAIDVNLNDNHWPQFRTKEDNEAAKEVMKAAFAECGIQATGGEGRKRSITISAKITIEASAPPLLPQGPES